LKSSYVQIHKNYHECIMQQLEQDYNLKFEHSLFPEPVQALVRIFDKFNIYECKPEIDSDTEVCLILLLKIITKTYITPDFTFF
jgi:hypothetical protein